MSRRVSDSSDPPLERAPLSCWLLPPERMLSMVSDCTWPMSPEIVWDGVHKLPEATINKITHLNAMREFSYDPFSLLGRENCTVGALRAKATHVSIEPRPGMGGAAPDGQGERVVTSGDIQKMFAAAAADSAL